METEADTAANEMPTTPRELWRLFFQFSDDVLQTLSERGTSTD